MDEIKLRNSDQLSALALKYQGDYGTASGDLSILDLVNQPTANGVCSVFGLSLPEEIFDFVLFDFGALIDDSANTFLITQE